jgi:predicted PurR-regulated permease PerM
VAIIAVLVGANLAGVLGALLAIPTAASLGVLIDELVLSGSPGPPQTAAANTAAGSTPVE